MNSVTGPANSPQQPSLETIHLYRLDYASTPFLPLPEENLAVRAAIRDSYPRLDPAVRVAELELRYPAVFAAMKAVGAHPFQVTATPNPYDTAAAPERFSNMGLHMVQALLIVEPLADALQERGILSAEEALSVRERTLAHDLNKPAEVARRNAALRGKFGGDPYSDAAYEAQAQILERAGVSPDLIQYIVTAGSETGHGSFKRFVTCNGRDFGVRVRENWVAALVHLADDMAYSTKPQAKDQLDEPDVSAVVTPLDRMILSHFESTRPKLGYPWMWQKGLGVDHHGEVIDVDDIHAPPPGVLALGSYAFFQPAISGCICSEIKAVLDPDGTRVPVEFVRAFVQAALDYGRI